MLGKSVLYLPGFDHAGIATQTVVEKRLAKDKNLSRHDLGRQKFVELVWEWKEKYVRDISLLKIDTMRPSNNS
jgi:valyl-tRNA synthetase